MFGMSWIRSELVRLKRDTRGSFIMVFGLTLIPMLGLLGLGVDYSAANRLTTAFDAANDSAVLAGLTAALQVIESNKGSTASSVTTAAQLNGQSLAAAVFNADSDSLPVDATINKKLKNSTANYAVTITRPTNLTLSAVATYNAASHNIFGELFGAPAWLVTGTATAGLKLPTHTRVYMLLDVSQSMGIGATLVDMNNLQTLTKPYWPAGDDSNKNDIQGGCVFGCHVAVNNPEGSQICPPAANCPALETVAENNGVQLRIDYLRKAVNDAITNVQTQQIQIGYNTIQLGLYTMGQTVKTIVAPTDNVTTLQGFATTQYIDLEGAPVVNENGPGDSYITTTTTTGSTGGAISSLVADIKADVTPGDGSSEDSPLIAVLIVTDGVNDVSGTQAQCGITGHCITAFDSSACSQITALNQGTQIGVIYASYIPFTTVQQYAETVGAAGINTGSPTTLETQLQNCATGTALYAEATSGPEIELAIDNIFNQVLHQGILQK